MNGVLPLWKPKGLSSHDCVVKVRQLFQTKKVGHTGTLDPEVEGVLPLCIGQATKIVPYLTPLKKVYQAEVQLGVATETEDAYGKIIDKEKIKEPLSLQTIDDVLQSFKGKITQIPPMYSAVRVKGKRLYEYARANKEVTRPKREVTIYHIERISPLRNDGTSFKIKVACSKGTYIRTLCVDIGKSLGYPAHMSHLVRIESSSFKSEDTMTLEELQAAQQEGTLKETLFPMKHALRHMEVWHVNASLKRRVLHGQKLKHPKIKSFLEPFLVMYKDQLIAIYQTHPQNSHYVKPVRVFSG